MLKYLNRRLRWLSHAIKLRRMESMEEFLAYVQRARPPEFLRYQARSEVKRREFATVIDLLGISLEDRKVLDLGPGYGDALDICHARGAHDADFVELEPFFFTYNRLKGIGCAYRLDHLYRLGKLESGKYDLIWCKGSIGADCFAGSKFWRGGWFLDLERWLLQIRRIAANNATIVICPHWRNNGRIREIQDLQNNRFSRLMTTHGYTVVDEIPEHNCQPGYPITFVAGSTRHIVPRVLEYTHSLNHLL